MARQTSGLAAIALALTLATIELLFRGTTYE
jgi:hypothetical protein